MKFRQLLATITITLASLTSFSTEEFCKIVDGKIKYAPDILRMTYYTTNVYSSQIMSGVEDGRYVYKTVYSTNISTRSELKFEPEKEDYLACGWYCNGIVPPVETNGWHVAETTYAILGKSIVAVYRYEENPYHTYRRSYLAQWFFANNVWTNFQGLISMSPEGSFFWETSTEFDSNHPKWQELLGFVQQGLALTDEQIDSMLHYGEYGN